MPEPVDVTIVRWMYRHPCNAALVSERYSVRHDGRSLITRSTLAQARSEAEAIGWRVVDVLEEL